MMMNSVTKNLRLVLPVQVLLVGIVLVIDKVSCQSTDCEVFPADSIFNTRIDGLPVDRRSDEYVASIGVNTNVHPDFGSGEWNGNIIGIPFNRIRKQIVSFQYGSESDNVPYPIPYRPLIEGGSDRHLLMIDEDDCTLYELFAARRRPNRTPEWRAGSGAVWSLNSNDLRPASWTSADAAGLPIFPLLIQRAEVEAGEIKHAVRFTASTTQRKYIWPARHFASSNTDPNVPPMGQRFRLKSNFDILGFSRDNQVILTALKRYGMFLADNGSNWFLSGDHHDDWDNDELRELRRLQGSDFEAVDESSLMIDEDSARARTPP